MVWGNHTSVLAGDWLYMQAFQIALRERQFPILDVLINLTQLMVEGELMQLESIGKMDATEAEYMELIDRKTASLFSGLCEPRSDEQRSGRRIRVETRLGEYAWNLGIAFQLVDDILDFTSREKILGKPVGNDLREGKVTLPLDLRARIQPSRKSASLVETVLADGNYDQVPFGKILQLLHRHNGIERAQQLAQTFTEKARTIMAEFPESPYQRGLMSVTDLVTARDR